jgi:hypothetical protein
MESWRKGVAPLLSGAALKALKTASEIDDPTLVQGVTTQPPPLPCVLDWPVEAACARDVFRDRQESWSAPGEGSRGAVFALVFLGTPWQRRPFNEQRDG